MKKFIGVTMLTLLMFSAGAQSMYCGTCPGKNVRFTFPRLTDSNKDYMFPTYDNVDKADNDTIAVTVHDLETFVTADTLTSNTYLIITVDDYIKAGAKLYTKFAYNDTSQIVYVKQGSRVIDTFAVNDYNTTQSYIYTGTYFERLSPKSGNTGLIGAVTQASSITTGVTLNADDGVITTVSSTIAADDSSASFTLTNNKIKAGSVIQLTCGTAGNGRPEATITSQTGGSAVIKLWNGHRQAALNAVVKIHFTVKNR